MLKRISLAVVLLLSIHVVVVANEIPKELDAYLTLPDNSFRWDIAEEPESPNDQTFLLDVTSQTWQGSSWKHYVLVAVPNKVTNPNHALLLITGGSIGRKPGAGDKVRARLLAETSGMCVAILLQVPNQPLFGNYTEDALIGETLIKALETKDTTWPLLFPMAKSAVKTMDAVQEMLKKEKQLEINHFIVTGGSKRGWTTWLTAASGDKRVVAIVPMVIDNLNTKEQMKYQIETWGDYSLQIRDYTSRNLVRVDNTPQSEFEQSLGAMIDPYSYRSRLSLPKLLVHGTNDPYWTVDAAKFYFDDLPGVKYILTLPNAGHGLEGQLPKALQTTATFAKRAAKGGTWPAMKWKLNEKETEYQVTVESDITPHAVKLWTAQSETKDFRKAKWTSASVEPKKPLTVSVAKPAAGHIAFFIELESSDDGLPFSLTTQVWRF
jgi:PhoPQ-activated pathogenicity-related protein